MIELIQAAPSRNPHTQTVEVYVRHSADCKSKTKGRFYRNCSCMKWLYIYQNGKKEERTAKTRSWEDADKQAQAIRDSWDPEKLELMQLRHERDRRLISFNDAVKNYFADLKVAGTSPNTIDNYARVLGDPEGTRKGPLWKGGSLPNWIAEYNRKHGSMGIHNLSDLTQELLREYRGTWPKAHPRWNDYTTFQMWLSIKIFFKWCIKQKCIADNPVDGLSAIKMQSGSRTAPFTDVQMDKIISACEQYSELCGVTPEIGARTKGLILVMRHGGMALADAILLKPEYIDEEGVLKYRRVKLHGRGRSAEVPLPKWVVKYLQQMPMEENSYPGYFFRTAEHIRTDKAKWSHRLKSIFQIAGIASVQTELRKRSPHSHMFRDTFAVWCITHDIPLLEVSKMLGHTNTAVTEKAYLMWGEKRKDKMVSRMRGLFGEETKKK